MACSPSCGSPEGIRIGKPSTVAPSCDPTPTEACNISIVGNTFQYVIRNSAYWPSSGWSPVPGVTCSNANGCHEDAIHIWGIDGANISNNILYGDECQGIFIEPTNNSLNANVTIVGNAISSLNGGCSDKAIYVNANGATSGTWNIGFNSAPGLLDLGDGFAGDRPGTVFNLYGNFMDLFLSNAAGNAISCTNAPNGNTAINYEYDAWVNAKSCSSTDHAGTAPDWVNSAAAPAVGLDMHLAGGGVATGFVPCRSLIRGSCPSGVDGFGNPWPSGTANAGADQSP